MSFIKEEDEKLFRNVSGDLIWRDVLDYLENSIKEEDLISIKSSFEKVFDNKIEKDSLIHFIKLMTAYIAREERRNSNKKTKQRTSSYNSSFDKLYDRIKKNNEN